MKSKQSPKSKKPAKAARSKAMTQEEHIALKAEIFEMDAKDRLCREVVKDFEILLEFADLELANDKEGLATGVLTFLATIATLKLNEQAKKKPEVFQEHAMEALAWPVLFSAKPKLNKAHAPLVKSLRLSESITTGRKTHLDERSCRGAWVVYIVGSELVRKGALPKLTATDKRSWFDAAWDALLGDGAFKPEENELLAPLGKWAIGKKSTSRGMSEQTEGMKRDDVRADIKAAVWEAFDKQFVGSDEKKSK